MLFDRYGRRPAAAIVLTVMTIGYGFLSSSGVHLTAGATVIGLGNGASSGAVMLLGTDLAPDGDPRAAAEFLGKWRMMTHVGSLLSPLVVGLVTQVANGRAAAFALALMGWAGLGCVLVFMKETSGSAAGRAAAKGADDGDRGGLIELAGALDADGGSDDGDEGIR